MITDVRIKVKLQLKITIVVILRARPKPPKIILMSLYYLINDADQLSVLVHLAVSYLNH